MIFSLSLPDYIAVVWLHAECQAFQHVQTWDCNKNARVASDCIIMFREAVTCLVANILLHLSIRSMLHIQYSLL